MQKTQMLLRRLLVVVAAVAIVAASVQALRAQAPRMRYVTGQNIQPVFEGWEPNADGTFNLVFGYLNRNLGDEVNLPVGKDNALEPGGPDQGQPGYFYPGRQEFEFRVKVPKDFGNKELVWTLTVGGSTLKAYGTLLPVWQIDKSLIVFNTIGGAKLSALDKNEYPTVTIDPASPVTLPGTANLSATVKDDGVPGPRPERPQRGGDGAAEGRGQVFLNAPLPPPTPGPPPGLSLRWVQWRGPAKVTFDPPGAVPTKSGEKRTAKATFTEPGTYVLRAIGHDSILRTYENVTVVVNGTPTPR